ncbi:MAG: LPS-assembly lipoprotein LptE [Panacagrimonas sp.]
MRLGLLLTSAMLSACRFHVAGNRPLPEPLKLVRIDMVAPYKVSEPPVEASLRNRLLRRGAEVVEKSRDDVTVIRLTDLKGSREVLSVGPDGKALEYELILRVNYDVRTGTQVWVPPEQIEVRRDFSFNAEQVLPKEQEAERLREFLEDEMAEVLLLRIEAAIDRAVLQAPPLGAAPVGVVPVEPPSTSP